MQQVTYVRLYADDSGESHFEDMTIDDFKQTDFAPPAEPLNVAAFLPATGTTWLHFPAGWDGTEPHPSPSRQVMCILQGEFEVTVSDGGVRILRPGSVILLENTWGKGHVTRIAGQDDGVILAVALTDQ